MPRGDKSDNKSSYTEKQKHQAERIEQSYEARGVDSAEAEARAWATVNKQSGGGEKSGGGRKVPARRKAAARRDSAKRAAATKHGHSPNRGRASSRKTRRPASKTAAGKISGRRRSGRGGS